MRFHLEKCTYQCHVIDEAVAVDPRINPIAIQRFNSDVLTAI